MKALANKSYALLVMIGELLKIILKLEALSNNYSKSQETNESNDLSKLASKFEVYVFFKIYGVSKSII